jgi:hypothetical protein
LKNRNNARTVTVFFCLIRRFREFWILDVGHGMPGPYVACDQKDFFGLFLIQATIYRLRSDMIEMPSSSSVLPM